MNTITSKNNNKIKDLIKLRDDSKFRNDKSLFYVEGERIIKDTPIELINEIYVSDNKVDEYKHILDNYNSDIIYIINNEIVDKIKDTINSQGIFAVVKYNHINKIDEIDLNSINSILVLSDISDPGNVGTIIRLSEAANIDLIVVSSKSCSIYNTKVVRSCMSSIFRKKIYISNNLESDLQIIKQKGFRVFSTILNKNSKRYTDVDFKNKSCVIFGNEAIGITDEIVKISDDAIYIPMCGNIESLNVSVAASIVCYEIMRQNNYYGI